MLSNNEIFHGLGNAYGKFTLPTLEVPTWNSLDVAIANNQEEVQFDMARMDLHNFLYNVCLSFIMRHEIRHIANGHVGYILDKNRPFFFENSGNGLSALDSQTLEMDVDSCVFAGLLEGFLVDKEHVSMMPEELQDQRGKMMTCLFCIQFLFYCLPSNKVGNRAEASRASHPNACLRYFFCFSTGISLLQEKYPELLEEFSELNENNFGSFLSNLAGMGLIDEAKIIADQEWTLSDDGIAYAHEIWNNCDNWIPKLEKYAYLKLAPPNSPSNRKFSLITSYTN